MMLPLNIPTHETARLILRPWREADLDGLVEFHTDPITNAVYRMPVTRPDLWRRMAMQVGHWALRGFGPWTIEDKASGRYAGQCGHWFPEGWADVEIGYGIHPGFRGRGFAVEAATLVRDLGYQQSGFPRLVSYIQPSNANSIRVAEKMGAKVSGTFDMNGVLHTVYEHQRP